jgi:hypothetical protein
MQLTTLTLSESKVTEIAILAVVRGRGMSSIDRLGTDDGRSLLSTRIKTMTRKVYKAVAKIAAARTRMKFFATAAYKVKGREAAFLRHEYRTTVAKFVEAIAMNGVAA